MASTGRSESHETTTTRLPESIDAVVQRARNYRVTRRSFLLKGGGALGGVVLGLYMSPSITSFRVPTAHANVSPGLSSSSSSLS